MHKQKPKIKLTNQIIILVFVLILSLFSCKAHADKKNILPGCPLPNAFLEFNLSPQTVITEEFATELDPLGRYCWARPWEIEKRKNAVAELTYVFGIVHLTPNDGSAKRPARRGEILEVGDVIETSRRSKAEIIYRRNFIISVNPMTKIAVEANPSRDKEGVWKTLKLFFGFIYTHGRKKDELYIQTPRAVVGVRGTTFNVDLTDRGSEQITVLDGRVVIEPSITQASEALQLKRNDRVSIAKNTIEKSKFSDTERFRLLNESRLSRSRRPEEIKLSLDLHEWQQMSNEQKMLERREFYARNEVISALKQLSYISEWLKKLPLDENSLFVYNSFASQKDWLLKNSKELKKTVDDLNNTEYEKVSFRCLRYELTELINKFYKTIDGMRKLKNARKISIKKHTENARKASSELDFIAEK